ncbi:uncharacterized protein PSANT_06030 [Moesziomyces antarcticus]|uniref:Uncharacterized protein n=1 Tax=Pseudozyma antarctica TaxID=84753 RepID=A0A5C3FXG5_PSEA2|nr:uncharacterized protein PSANT_06030 [Moesziomyces antarcticus]
MTRSQAPTVDDRSSRCTLVMQASAQRLPKQLVIEKKNDRLQLQPWQRVLNAPSEKRACSPLAAELQMYIFRRLGVRSAVQFACRGFRFGTDTTDRSSNRFETAVEETTEFGISAHVRARIPCTSLSVSSESGVGFRERIGKTGQTFGTSGYTLASVSSQLYRDTSAELC